MPHTMAHGNAMQECIDSCNSCHDTCLECVRHCLTKGGKHADPAHITLLLDCSQICEASADFMIRQSAHHKAICRACAEVCRACAKSCDALGDDDMMRKCAEECRRCAESCAKMAGAA